MIVQASELTPQQKAAIEELLGKQLLEREQIEVLVLGDPTVAQARQRAAEELRAFLATPRKPRPGVSDEEFEAAFLEAMRSVRPSYTPYCNEEEGSSGLSQPSDGTAG
jgi:hypothetical protein